MINDDLEPSTFVRRSPFTRRSLLTAVTFGLGGLAMPSLLTACTGETGPVGNKPKSLDNVEQLQLGRETEGMLYPKGYVGPRASVKEPFHDGSKTFKVVVQQDAKNVGDWAKNDFTAWLEKRTGLKIEYQAVLTAGSDGSTDLTKINAMLASGELPDAFLSIPFSDDQVSLYGSQGVFVGLQDYIQTYAPEMRRVLTDYPDLAKLTTAKDGNVYQFRGINDCYHCRVSPGRAFINQKYLDRVGAQLPETTEDLRQVLELFKDKDPTGTGKMIPFAASIGDQVDRYIMNAFLYNPGGDRNGGWLTLSQGKINFVATTDEWREGLRFLRSLSEDGTLNRDAFTMTGEELLRAGNQGRLGFVRSYYWGAFVDIDYDQGSRWRDYVSMPPLKGPGGVRYAAWDHYAFGGERLLITSACENPELLVQWADAQLELEAVMGGFTGTKDDNWSWAEKGQHGINGKQAVWRQQQWPPPEGQSWLQYSTMYRSNDFRLGEYADPKNPSFEKDLYEATTIYEPHAQPKEMQLPPLIFDESQAAQKADTAVAIEAHVKQHLAKFALGDLDIDDDSDWKAYLETFDKMGLPAYLDLYQAAHDATS